MPRDAEAWLAERGIEREPIRLMPSQEEVVAETAAIEPGAGSSADRADTRVDTGNIGAGAAIEDGGGDRLGGLQGPAPSAREVAQLAQASGTEAARRDAEAAATRPPPATSLADDISEGLAFVRRSTANAPQSVGKLRRKLAERETPAAAIDRIIEQAHVERLVDDRAMATALVEEWRAKGHAPLRLRQDLRKRGFDDQLIAEVLAPVEAEDQEAAAFAVARDKAFRLTGVTAETALRRTVAHVARRGYPEGLARKVARLAVDVSRDPERAAGH